MGGGGFGLEQAVIAVKTQAISTAMHGLSWVKRLIPAPSGTIRYIHVRELFPIGEIYRDVFNSATWAAIKKLEDHKVE